MFDAILKLAVVVPLVIMAGAALVFAWAWRGRLVDFNPVCRWCGFDLSGREVDAARCPECWGGVSQAYGVRTSGVARGHRQVRAGWAATAGLLFAATFLIAFGAAFVRLAGTGLYGRYPVSLLSSTVIAGDESERGRAAYELSERMRLGQVRRGELNPLLDRLLTIQLDHYQAWRPVYADTLLAARSRGLMDDARWDRYVGELTRAVKEDPDPRASVIELRNCALSGCMARGELDPALDVVLGRQGDLAAAWWTGYGDLVQSARTVSLVDDARWGRYVRQAIVTTVSVGPELRRSGTLALTTVTRDRGGTSRESAVADIGTSLQVTGTTAAGEQVTVSIPRPGSRMSAVLNPARPLVQNITFDGSPLRSLANGPVTVAVTQRFELVPQPRFGRRVEATDVRVTSGPSTLAGADEVPPEDVSGQSEALRSAVSRVSIRRGGPPGDCRANVSLTVYTAPFDLAADVILDCGDGRAVVLGTLSAARDRTAHLQAQVLSEAPLPGKVRIRLRPDDAVSRRLFDGASPKFDVTIPEVSTTEAAAAAEFARLPPGTPTTRLAARAR